MKNWFNTPSGIVAMVGVSALVTELLFMIFLEDSLRIQFRLSNIVLGIIDIAIVTVIISPALFLVFRKITESEEKFRKITISAQDAIILMDNDARVSFWNAAAERIFGYTADEAMGRDMHSLIAPAAARILFARSWSHFKKSGACPMVGEMAEVTAMRKNGEEFPVELSVSATQINGQWHAIGIIRDITERKQAEENLLRANQNLQIEKRKIEEGKAQDEAVMANLGEGMIATDNEGRILIMNHAAEKILGWSTAEVLGKKAVEVFPATDDTGKAIPPEKRTCLMVSAKGNTATLMSTSYLMKKDGGRIPVAETATPIISNGKKTGAVVIFRDITDEREIEKTRGDLLTLASHQLRTPLSGTKWLIETLKRGIHGPLTNGQKEYLDEIYKINERMTSLVYDMLGVLRMESGIIPTKMAEVSIHATIATLLDTLGAAAKSNQVTVRSICKEDCTFNTDPLLLENILESLVSNAITYSPAGGEVILSVEKKPAEVVFSIQDFGIGIPKDEQGQLFQQFYRASNAKTFNTRGTGLGLYVATTLAKKIGARLSFESEEGKGSTFYVHLPAKA